MTEIAGRRANELRDLMTVLELRTVDLHDGLRIAEQHLSRGFDQSRLARACRPQQKEVGKGAARSRETCPVYLVDPSQLPNGAVLSDEAPAQVAFEIFDLGGSHHRIKDRLSSIICRFRMRSRPDSTRAEGGLRNHRVGRPIGNV